ncbi:MAG: RHS repeat-associated core domain-containing protein [Dehalococcoidales bacterium]|nr:RHS repeat-associated core domain-containing protein [Dehalococcoidales bacterium]
MTSDNGTSLGTIKYYPFGGTRAGDVPTDIKFTGQRLDDTGLYYYNARYYDATIGRFISADAIVPGPANPQNFNRYSYCLNNPLKYIDPSGHDVEIGGINTKDLDSWTFRDWIWALKHLPTETWQLIAAWMDLVKVAPDLAQALEDYEGIITIQWQNTYNGHDFVGCAPRTLYYGKVIPLGIFFNTDLQSRSTAELASYIAHEAFHVLMAIHGYFTNSIFEESCAYGYQHAVYYALTGSYDPSNVFANVDPKFDLVRTWSNIYHPSYLGDIKNKKWSDNGYNHPDMPDQDEGPICYMQALFLWYYPY